MNRGFRRNALLTNTTLILLRYICGILIISSTCCELIRGQTYGNCIPELILSLSQPYRCI